MARINPKVPNNAKKVFEGVIFDMYQWDQKMYDGSIQIFEKLARADTACVLPITSDKKIILIKDSQPGNENNLRMAGGRLEYNESFEQAAKREMKEEIGYDAKEFKLYLSLTPYSKIDWQIQTFIAKDSYKVSEQQLDVGEKIELVFLNFDELMDLASNDMLKDEPDLVSNLLKARISKSKLQDLKQLFFE